MTYSEVTNNITYFVHTVLKDLKKLLEIADSVADDEFRDLQKNGHVPTPTTNPHGKNVELYVHVASRCTIPITMVCFSVIDFLGKLNDEKFTKEEFRLGQFQHRAKIFKNFVAGMTLNTKQP